jgi:hypothetical protein
MIKHPRGTIGAFWWLTRASKSIHLHPAFLSDAVETSSLSLPRSSCCSLLSPHLRYSTSQPFKSRPDRANFFIQKSFTYTLTSVPSTRTSVCELLKIICGNGDHDNNRRIEKAQGE